MGCTMGWRDRSIKLITCMTCEVPALFLSVFCQLIKCNNNNNDTEILIKGVSIRAGYRRSTAAYRAFYCRLKISFSLF